MRLWEFGVQDCRLDQLTISLTITSLPLNESLHDAARTGLDFPRQVHDFIKLIKDVRGLEDLVQNWSLYSSWCSFQSFFKKNWRVPAALPTQGKTAEKSPKESSVIGDFYSVSCQIVVYRTQLRPRWHGPVSATGRWAGIFKFRIC